MKRIIIISIFIVIIFGLYFILNNKKLSKNEDSEENTMIREIYLKINNYNLTVTLEDNSSTEALVNKLKNNDIIIDAKEYGGFEKVGSLNFNLPTNDTKINATSGDLILYNGNEITLIYGKNTWNCTLLGKVQNINESELKNILGNGDIKITISINN